VDNSNQSGLGTVKQAALFLQVSPSKVFALIRSGKLTRVKLAERTTRVRWSELHKIAGVGE
jgi:excisionase family DNA binding protein